MSIEDRRKRAANDLAHRFLDVIEHYGEYNFESLASQMGTNTAALHRLIKGKAGLGLLIKILLTFDQVSADWLLLGRGDMIRKSEPGMMSLVNESAESYSKPDVLKVEIAMRDKIISQQESTIQAQKEHIETLKETIKNKSKRG